MKTATTARPGCIHGHPAEARNRWGNCRTCANQRETEKRRSQGILPRSESPKETLLSKMEILPSGCWLWLGAKANGYGRIKDEEGTTGVHQMAARIWLDWDGEGWVLHTCDVRACFNPAHLYIGDRAQNTRDAINRCRMGKLSYQQRDELTTRLRLGEPVKNLAKEFGIHEYTVRSYRRKAVLS